jgi:hypothetical protein
MTTPTKTTSRKSTKSQKSSSALTESTSSVAQVEDTKPQQVVVEVKVQEPVVEVQEPVVEVQEPVVEQQEVVGVNHFETLNSKVKQAQTLLRDLSTELNHLQKEVDKLKKSSKKSQSKSRKSATKTESTEGGSTTRSGINKEVNVSEQLASFLNVPVDTKVSRIQVSRAVSEYITKHNLQNPSDRRNILLDETLTKLLNPPQNVNVSYFNLQTYLKPHYRS